VLADFPELASRNTQHKINVNRQLFLGKIAVAHPAVTIKSNFYLSPNPALDGFDAIDLFY
jgi:hypothetical protein